MEYTHIKKVCLVCVQYFDAKKLEAHFNEKHFCGFCDIPVKSKNRHKHMLRSRKCRFCDEVVTHSSWQKHFAYNHFKRYFENGVLIYQCLQCDSDLKIYDELKSHILNNHRGSISNLSKKKKL